MKYETQLKLLPKANMIVVVLTTMGLNFWLPSHPDIFPYMNSGYLLYNLATVYLLSLYIKGEKNPVKIKSFSIERLIFILLACCSSMSILGFYGFGLWELIASVFATLLVVRGLIMLANKRTKLMK